MEHFLPSYAATPSQIAQQPSERLPDYSESGASTTLLNCFCPTQEIDDKLPNHFKINDHYVVPQVLPSDLEAHLLLLGSFRRMREEVMSLKGADVDISLRPEERYSVFLHKAVYRFERWVLRITEGASVDEDLRFRPRVLKPNEVPPLDVVMVWHTYMLNPRTYYEDCLRKLPELLRIGSFPLTQLAASIDRETLLSHPPSPDRVATFTSLTGQQFVPPINTTFEDTLDVSCPNCSYANIVPWVTHNGDGYAQDGFSCSCSGCKFRINKETLGMRKFYADVECFMANPNLSFMANTVLDYQTSIPVSPKISKALCLQYLRLQENTSPVHPASLGKQIGWTFKALETYCMKGLRSKRDRSRDIITRHLGILFNPYRSPGLASLDLANAVMRQMSFIEKIGDLGFTEPGRWENDNDTLTRCVVRYHHFLDLTASLPGKFAVPTLDIDLAWHTHQLLCKSYRELKDIIGIIPDHDDKIAQGAISAAYDSTAEAWKERFRVPYSVCGCLPPLKALQTSESTSAKKVLSMFSKKGKSKAPPAESGAIPNPRPDLLSPSHCVPRARELAPGYQFFCTSP